MTSDNRQPPDSNDVLAWAKFYTFVMRWVIVPIHKPMGYAENGRAICSCELENGRKWPTCNPEKPGKHPWRGWKQVPMETPEEGFAAFTAIYDKCPDGVNIGIRTGRVSNMWAVDLDVGSMKFGIQDFENWMKANGLAWDAFDTLTAVTGGGGRHLVFPYPDKVEKITTVAPHADLGKAVDVKGDGGYILVHPSLHTSGRIYEWQVEPSPTALKPAPEKLVTTVQGRKREAPGVADVGYTPSLRELKDYADELIRKRSPRSKEIGKNMADALAGKGIMENGGAHDAYRDIAFMIAKRWRGFNSREVAAHFQDSITQRFANKENASTDMANLMDSLVTALEKANEEASGWAGQLSVNEAGRPIATNANLLLYFRNHAAWQGVIGYNLRRNRPVYLKRPPLAHETPAGDIEFARDYAEVCLWFQHKAQMAGSISEKVFRSALLTSAWERSFDPLVDLLTELRGQWDGVRRLETALQRVAGTPDSEWVRLVFPLWMMSLVKRILEPGCKVDTMLILEGDQGWKKSTFFSSLLPDRQYFSDSLNKVGHDAEVIRLIHSGPCIFETGELNGLRRQEVESIKAFLSSAQDDLRPLFEPHRSTPRRCIFVGSTNGEEYLHDETGGRRFWPVKVTMRIAISIVLTERAQWFAEALHRVEAGEQWWIEGAAAEALAKAEQDERYEEDIWTPPIKAWLANEVTPVANPTTATEQMASELNKQKAGEFVTTIQVALYALKIELKDANGADARRIRGILQWLGWTRCSPLINGVKTRVWRRPGSGGDGK